MKTPRDISGRQLGKLLSKFGYRYVSHVGSHMRYVTYSNGEHYVTIPDHSNLRIGTLDSIIRLVADHLEISKESVVESLSRKRVD